MNKKNTTSVKKILIIGSGVSGLTTAYSLQNANYKVTVVAEKFSPNITSNVAGALWEWPPAVCGYHVDQVSLDRSKTWCMDSYSKFLELEKIEEAGVFIRPVYFFFRKKVSEDKFNLMKMNELKEKVKGFKHDATLIREEGINPNIGLVDAYCHLAPMVNTDVYMPWLMQQVKDAGAKIIQTRLSGVLIDQLDTLLELYECDFIVNCAGLGASELANEYMFPLRGALVRIKNVGDKFSILEKAYCVSFDEQTREQDIVFIVPRGKDRIVLGALAEENEWSLDINIENHQPIKEMFQRCKEFLPYLEKAELDENEPVRIGLRPFRKGNVRLEKEPGYKIIHNYGHGGAGVTFSWGCAKEIVHMIDSFNQY